MNPFRRLVELSNNLPARHKYVLYGGAMLFSVILLMSIVSLIIFSSTLDRKERESTQMRVAYTVQTVKSELDSYRRVLDIMYIDDRFHKMILDCAQKPELIMHEKYLESSRYAYYYDNMRDIKLYLNRLISSCKYRPEIKLYIADRLLYYKYSTEVIDSVSSIAGEKWFQEASASDRVQMRWWVQPGVDKEDGRPLHTLYCSLALRRIRIGDNEREAYVLLSSDMNWLNKPLRTQIDTENGSVYIMDRDGALIYPSGGSKEGEEVCAAVRAGRTGEAGYMSYGGKRGLVYYDEVDYMGWTLVYLTSARAYLPEAYSFQLFSLICLVPIILISLFLLLLSSRFMTKRLASLTEAVQKIDEEHLELDSQFSGGDEVGVLSDAFRKTLQMVRELLERNRAVERERYRTELQILQERINPHFLYNTLSSINVMAVDIDAWSISDALSGLADFYRLSLSHGGELISMHEELNILEKYIEICRLRFGDRVKVTIDVPERLCDNRIPKLLFQPFLENSILHGLRTRADVQDEVIISAAEDGEELLLCIKDNGMGIDGEKMQRIIRMADDGRYHAISSTDRRIKLIYGQRYGVVLESAPGVGTTVRIRIPNEKMPPGGEESQRLEQF